MHSFKEFSLVTFILSSSRFYDDLHHITGGGMKLCTQSVHNLLCTLSTVHIEITNIFVFI